MPRSNKLIYLDHASTTPVDADLLSLYKNITLRGWGNPSSPYSLGQRAKALLDEARERAAVALGVDFNKIIFTSGATEANNLAMYGAVSRALHHDVKLRGAGVKPKILISAIEHKSVLEPALRLKEEGRIELGIIPVSQTGIIDVGALENQLDERTILVSVMWVNNETGAIQPIRKIAEAIARHREAHRTAYPLFHSDAVQAFQSVDVDATLVDYMTLGAHKLYAPKGSGILLVQNTHRLSSQLQGGGQEYDLRSGTENVAAHYTFSKSLQRALENRPRYVAEAEKLSEHLIASVLELVPRTKLVAAKGPRSPHIASFIIDGVLSEDLIYLMDQSGICVSSGSACTTGTIEVSHVLAAMGYEKNDIRGSLRFSIGKHTTKAEITFAVRVLGQAVGKLRGK